MFKKIVDCIASLKRKLNRLEQSYNILKLCKTNIPPIVSQIEGQYRVYSKGLVRIKLTFLLLHRQHV